MKKILFLILLFSIGAVEAMERNDLVIADLIATRVAEELNRRSLADCGDYLPIMISRGTIIGAACALGKVMLINPITEIFLNAHFHLSIHPSEEIHVWRDAICGGVAGLAIWVKRNPAAARLLRQQLNTHVTRSLHKTSVFVAAQFNKERDWHMLDEQLAANNTF